MLLTSRRAFLGGLISALAAPAIVHATNIMPVRSFLILPEPTFDSFDKLMPDGMQYQWVDLRKRDDGAWVTIPTGTWKPVPAFRHVDQISIKGDIIQVGGMTLVERPKAICDAARNEEIRAANDMTKAWAARCMANGFEGGVRYSQPTTVDFTRLSEFGATS